MALCAVVNAFRCYQNGAAFTSDAVRVSARLCGNTHKVIRVQVVISSKKKKKLEYIEKA